MSEKFSLKWNDFQSNVSRTFGQLRSEEEFFDVSLVSDDQKIMSAHKLVLSASDSHQAHCNEALCPGVVLLIVGLVLLLLFAPLGFLCYRNKYSRLHTPNISFRVPNIIRLGK